jgi:hypothetical protein
MSDYRIEKIDKPGGSHNPSTRIIGVVLSGGQYITSDSVISYILSNTHRFFVFKNNTTVEVEVGHRLNIPYLRTKDDQTPLDNLLSLPNVSTIR